MRATVKILCSTVEIVYLDDLLKLCVDNIRWDYLLRSAVEIICCPQLVERLAQQANNQSTKTMRIEFKTQKTNYKIILMLKIILSMIKYYQNVFNYMIL